MTGSPLCRLLRRADFLAVAAKGKKWVAPGVVLQVLARPDRTDLRYGLTASKRVGGAVQRNRARRRLRALILDLLPQSGYAPADIVLIAKTTTVTRAAPDLRRDVEWCLKKLRVQPEAA